MTIEKMIDKAIALIAKDLGLSAVLELKYLLNMKL